jgi:membrane-anchored protein YejM (alkaline phosphatase superfamily)
MANFKNGLSDDEAKIRTFRNLVPAYRQKVSDIDSQILQLQNDKREYERQIDEMSMFLSEHGQTPKTMAEWSKDLGN